jgi:penicillin V acylase-like amidase (Ntn superfamily)
VPIKRDRGLAHALWVITAVLASLALLTIPVGLSAWDLLPKAGHSLVDPACTSFCLDNDGHGVFGSNYDNEISEGLLFVNQRGVTKNGWEAGTSGKVARWTAQYGRVTFNLAGVQMAWAGMNEAGLVISTMWLGETSNPAPDERPPLVSALWAQYQLDTCGTLEDVMVNDSRVRIGDNVNHYLICDRSGACAAVEFLNGGLSSTPAILCRSTPWPTRPTRRKSPPGRRASCVRTLRSDLAWPPAA